MTQTRSDARKRRLYWITAGLIAALPIGAAASLSLGAGGYFSIFDIISSPQSHELVFTYRLPHLILAIACGASLAATGATLQAVLLNPLAEPYILGVSGGAAAGAMLQTVFGLSGLYGRAVCAFAGACLAASFVVVAAGRKRRFLSPAALALSGVMINAFFSALIVLFLVVSERNSSREMLFWLMGTLGGYRTEEIAPLAALLCLLTAALSMFGHRLNLLSQGDEHARLFGASPSRERVLFIAASTLITAVTVSLCGLVGFVGFVAPHALRMAIGADNKALLPLSALAGASFVALCDAVARFALAPSELPIGVVTAFIGVPIFVSLLARSEHAGL